MGKEISRRPILYILIWLLAAQILSRKTARAQFSRIKVGVVLGNDSYAEMIFNCLSMALSDFYSSHPHYTTRLVLTNTDSDKDVVAAAAAAVDLLKNVQVQAIIGPMFSTQAGFLISLGHKANVPVITFTATSPSLTSTRTPYFIRTTQDDSAQVAAVGAVVRAFGWREVVPIYEDTEFGEGIIPHLSDALEHVNARIPYRSVISPLATDDQIRAELYKLMTMQTRVFVVHMLSSLASRLFAIVKQNKMMSKDYAWIVTDSVANDLGSMDPAVVGSMLGVIGIQPHVPQTKERDEFTIRYRRRNNPRGGAQDLDVYGLRAYDSAMALAMAAEKGGFQNPRYREANVSGTNSTDLKSIGVSEAGPDLIRAILGTTFTGLAGNFKLIDGQLQAPHFEIVNVVGPAARRIGYWTKENGITGELNFDRKYSTSKSNFGSIIWPGNVTDPPKGWVIPTNGNKLTVGVPVKPGYTEFVRVTWDSDNSPIVEGYSIDVFKAVMATVPGVPYEFVPFATPDRRMVGNYNELIYQVFLGKYDIVAGDVTIIANRSRFVDFTLPYTESGIAMIVPVEDKRKNAWIFVKPLTWQLWLTIFCSFIFIGSLVWVMEHQISEDFEHTFWYRTGMTLWFAFSIVVFAHGEKKISNITRLVLIIWFLLIFILTQIYTASFSSMLTVQNLKPKVQNIEMLIENKENVGYMQGSFVFEILKEMKIPVSRLREYRSTEELDQLLTRGTHGGGIGAAFHEIPYIKMFLNRYCGKYTRVEPIYKANGFGFVFPIGSPLVSEVSRAILNVTTSKQMMEIERKWFGQNKCADPNSPTSAANIGLGSCWGLFAVAFGAGLIALGICLFFRRTPLPGNRQPDPENEPNHTPLPDNRQPDPENEPNHVLPETEPVQGRQPNRDNELLDRETELREIEQPNPRNDDDPRIGLLNGPQRRMARRNSM